MNFGLDDVQSVIAVLTVVSTALGGLLLKAYKVLQHERQDLRRGQQAVRQAARQEKLDADSFVVMNKAMEAMQRELDYWRQEMERAHKRMDVQQTEMDDCRHEIGACHERERALKDRIDLLEHWRQRTEGR